MARFVQTNDDFDPATTCGLCGGPLDENGDSALTAKECAALMKVAEAAAVLFRSPYRRGAGILITDEQRLERKDFDRLYRAILAKDCPVDIGEELT
jgi:hypothetical protein